MTSRHFWWRGSMALAMLAVVSAVVRWQLHHPLPLFWDEANYVSQAILDHRFFQSGGVVRLVKALLFEDPLRPPAYRLLVLPWSLFLEPSIPALRCTSLLFSAIAFFFLYRAAWTLHGVDAALAGVTLLAAMPGIFLSAGWYGTEFPLFLSIGVLLFSLHRQSPLGISAAVALGLLSKVTFLLIAAPAILATALLNRRPRIFLAAAAGSLVASPWWFFHWRAAIDYARFGASGVRWQSPYDFRVRAAEVILRATGPLVFGAVCVVLIRFRGSDGERRPYAVAAFAALPLFLSALASPVFVARHFSPAFLPLVFILSAGAARLAGRERLIVGFCLGLQALAYALFPGQTLLVGPQFDWRILRPLVAAERPLISFVGIFPGLSPPEIRYAWLRDGRDADVRWLWSPEQPAGWPSLMTDAAKCDLVVVVDATSLALSSAPELLDNSKDQEAIRRLSMCGSFEPPVVLTLKAQGTFRPRVFAFRRKRGEGHTAAPAGP